jgi:ABC exporter DevB family membrane fusion protein
LFICETAKWSTTELMRLQSICVIAGLVVAIAGFFLFIRRQAPVHAKQEAVPGSQVLLASPGRVEGQGETISVGAAIDGVIESVLVTDGQQVDEGTALAVIDCNDLKASIEQAKAEAESTRQARVRLLRGRRKEERMAAAQKTAAAKAELDQAQGHLRMFETLYKKEEISRDSFEQVNRDYKVAQANYKSLVEEQALVQAKPLPEERSKADADVAAAEKNVSVAMEKLEKCTIRAPIAGTILKTTARVGEAYSTLLPRPLFRLADDSIRRVRAEVDEWDVGRVMVGQQVIVSADGFPGRQFSGRVIELGQAMGRRSILSGDPAEKADRDILEVIIELDESGKELPIGLRVTAQFF